MKKKLGLLIGIVLLMFEAVFFCWVVWEALNSTAFHVQGIVLILSIACVLGAGGSLLIAIMCPNRRYRIFRIFLFAMLCFWTIILLGNTLWNPVAFADGERGAIGLQPFSEIKLWLSDGMYLPLLSHLVLLFLYTLCLPIIIPKLSSRKILMQCTLCMLCFVGKFFVLGQFVSVDHILLWTVGGLAGTAMNYVLQPFTYRSDKKRKA